MKNKFLLLCLCLITFNIQATYDLSATAGYRSYILGAAARVDAGISQEMWRYNDQIYGFIRESAYFNTSGTINSVGGRIDFFPISILGFTAGTEQVWRSSKELSTFDCETQICDADGTRSYLRVENVLAYKKLVTINDFQREFFKYSGYSGIVVNALHSMEIYTDDIVNVMRNIIAYQYSDTYTFGVLHFRSWAEKSKQDTAFVGFLNQFKRDKWTYDTILGVNHDRDDHDHFSVLLQVKYDYKKGLRLF
ncbi:hypothetical protein ABMA79_12810 [Halobacteriovorax sp. HFRX-2_2]|uniref:hypothetical protein n=1 Tax=unclassified Halobacteriovorax TaxID=2639665 RepID=UPI00372269DC